MTAGTRRRLCAASVIALLVVPVEIVMLDALRVRDSREAARAWTSTLAADELDEASANLFSYPFEYRQAILASLTPERRAQAWQAVFSKFIERRPDLTGDQTRLLLRARTFVTPALLGGDVSADQKAQIGALRNEVVASFGEDVALELFMLRGGPPEIVPSLSIRQRTAEWIRSHVTVFARSAPCECAQGSSWCRAGQDPQRCGDSPWGCYEVCDGWPDCGDFWAYCCNGDCLDQE